MSEISKRHHYLPRCYLKGFTHNGKQLFLYDKQKDVVRPGNIEHSFYLWDRNTMAIPNGEKSDWLEKMYARIESDSAYLFPKIINSTSDKPACTYWDKLYLSFFIATLFWRVPPRDTYTRARLKNEGLKDTPFHIEYPDNFLPKDRERFEYLLSNDDNFEKAYRLLLSFVPYSGKNYPDFIESWKFYYQDPGRFIVGDDPLITKVVPTPNTILDEFLFPLSPSRILVASRRNPADLERDWTMKINLQQLKQAERYVCSNDERYLTSLVVLYKLENQTKEGDDFLPDLIFKDIS